MAANLVTATNSLNKALQTEPSDMEQAAAIRGFEFCFELSWKLLEERLRSEGVGVATPKAALRAAGDAGTIASIEDWLGYLQARNLTSPTYNQAVAHEVYAVISHGFVAAVQALVLLQVEEIADGPLMPSELQGTLVTVQASIDGVSDRRRPCEC
jgi:nucleotidyltransferase substrate binding protein (TIGR01987 family)